MSAKRFCVLPSHWTAENLASALSLHITDHRGRQTCTDPEHRRLTLAEIHDLELDDLIEWIHRPENRHDLGVVRIRRLEIPPARGLSCRVGAPLAIAVARGLIWARTMLADINTPTGF